MAVYTSIPVERLRDLCIRFGLGALHAASPAAEGVENTTYFLDTTTGRFVVTLFEHRPAWELEYFAALATFLADRGLPCARPRRHRHGGMVYLLDGRGALVSPRLAGASPADPTSAQLHAIGAALGQFHTAGQAFHLRRANDRWLPWCRATLARVASRLDRAALGLAVSELAALGALDLGSLPRGVIHGDLFRDNALFQGNRLTGIIDLGNACDAPLLFDLAIVANDWAARRDHSIDAERLAVLVEGYRGARRPTAAECAAWPWMLRLAALRFWLARIEIAGRRHAALVAAEKDPDAMRALLEWHIDNPSPLTT